MSYDCNTTTKEDMEGLGFFIMIFIILIPVIPAGDVGLYCAKQISEKPMVIMKILFWLGFIAMYSMLLLYIAENILDSLHVSILIFLVYFQGIIFAFLINGTEVAKFSRIIVLIITSIFDFLTSTT